MLFIARCFQRRSARRAAIQTVFVPHRRSCIWSNTPTGVRRHILLGANSLRSFILSFLFLFPTLCCMAPGIGVRDP